MRHMRLQLTLLSTHSRETILVGACFLLPANMCESHLLLATFAALLAVTACDPCFNILYQSTVHCRLIH